MATVRLPDELRRNLLALSTADDSAIDELYERLLRLEVNISAENLPDEIASKLTRWKGEEGVAAATALLGLSAFRGQAGQSADKTTEDVIAALKRKTDVGTKADLVLPEKDEARLRSRLLRLLSIASLNVSAKALGVLTDHQRAYISARILSDIRPVFADDIPAGPAAAVIVHSLKIEFMESGKRQEFFVALDSKDLRSMLELLNRAQSKDASLRALLAASKLPFLEPK